MRRPPITRRGNSAAASPQVLLRGLSVLEALNWRPISSVEQIAARTSLPKATIVRVLQNLAAGGYVQRLPLRKGYMLGERVLNLSSGFRSRDVVVEAARPLITAFTARHKWPVSLATLEIDSMRVRASSGAESPFATAIDRARLNRRVPLMISAHGRAYLAFCPEDERNIILALLRASTRTDDLVARDEHAVSNIMTTIRRAGYAITAPMPDEPAIGLSVPVFSGDRVLATLSLRYLGRAMPEAEVAKRYLAPLRTLAETIAESAARRPKVG
jgi:IclR family transcriptional regulator, mhp operon transcriptional activator